MTDEGFAALWVSDPWVPLRTFRAFSEDGAPLSPPREIDDSGRGGSVRADHRMLATANGFVAYARRGGLWAVALGLDASGAPTGPEHLLFEVKDDQEILDLSAARNGNSLTTVRIQWAIVGSLVAERTDRTGRPVGPERPITVGGSDGWFSTVRAAPVAPLGSGFATAWVTDSETLRFRELSRTGAPAGDTVELPPATEGCVSDVHLATSAGRAAVVYVEGCTQLDVVARSRRLDGTWSGPAAVTPDTAARPPRR